MQSVRVDPKRKLLIVEIQLPLRAGDPEAIRLSAEAGAGILDHAEFGALIVVRGGVFGTRPREVVMSVSECTAKVGAGKIACVGRPVAARSASHGSVVIVDFDSEDEAFAWLAQPANETAATS